MAPSPKTGRSPLDESSLERSPATGTHHMLRALLHVLAQYSIESTELFARARVPEGALGDSYRMSVEEEERLFELVLDLTGDAAFGFAWARRTHFTAWGAVSLVLAYSPGLPDVFRAIERYAPIFGGFELTYDERGREAAMRLSLSPRKGPIASRVYSEMFMGGMVRLLGNRSRACFRRADFAYASPESRAEYQSLFGEKVRFDASHTEFVMNRADVQQRLRVNASEVVVHAVRGEAEGMLERARDTRSLAWRVRRHLAAADLHAADMANAARALGVSVRSLRRRLSEEGLSWNGMLHEEWAARAQRLLGHLTIQATAFELGFADSSAFHHAFKKWTGRTPADFQRSLRDR